MSRSYRYTVAQFSSENVRDERLNLAVVVLLDDGLQIRIPRSLDKLRAISAALDVELVRETLERLPELDSYVRSCGAASDRERLTHIQELSLLRFSEVGEFVSPTQQAFDSRLEALLVKLVEPEPAPPRQAKKRPSRLFADVKLAFRSERVLARKGEGLEAHRIVLNHKVAEGLPADLMLKNGAMHIIQTVDASSEDLSTRRAISDVAVSALVFEQARMHFGQQETKARLVYRASSQIETMLAPALDAAEHQGAKLINWESRDDRVRFIVETSSLAEPLAEVKVTRSKFAIHASVQPKLKLN